MKSEHNRVNIWFNKIIFLGPPGRGKTVTRQRLVEEIENIESEEHEQPSTGTLDTQTFFIRDISRKTVVVHEQNWMSVKGHMSEDQILLKLILKAVQSPNLSSDDKHQESLHINEDASFDSSRGSDVVHEASPDSDSQCLFKGSKVVTHDGMMKAQNNAKVKSAAKYGASDITKTEKDIFEEVLNADNWDKISDNWDEISDHLENVCLLYIHDTGGQPELMDMLPALTIGPALYLLFCRLTDNLKGTFELCYRDEQGNQSIPVSSTSTIGEHLRAVLSSISYMTSCSQSEEYNLEDSDSSFRELILDSSKAAVYILGTYKDKVQEKNEIAAFDKELQDVIRPTDFYKKGLVHFASNESLVYPVDNKHGTKKDIKDLQEFVEGALKEHFKKLQIPARWLAFSLRLRNTGEKIMTLASCITLGKKHHMMSKETEVAIWFFHHRAGILMHFPNIPELKDVVIVDTQIIYDSITKLIVVACRFEGSVQNYDSENCRDTGQFKFESIEKACCNNLSPKLFEALLKHLSIVTSIPNMEQIYFMPCILNSALSEELDKFERENFVSTSIPSLVICYKCGFVPIGVFPALIAKLFGQSSSTMVSVTEAYIKSCHQLYHFSDCITMG